MMTTIAIAVFQSIKGGQPIRSRCRHAFGRHWPQPSVGVAQLLALAAGFERFAIRLEQKTGAGSADN